jgi:DNA-binding transcriptional ArsR family regulator
MTTNPVSDLVIHALDVRKAALKLRALNHPLRIKFLQFIHKEQKVMVTAIYIHFQIEQSVASQHLALLRRADIVHTARHGKAIYYSVNYEELNKWQGLFKTIV